MGLPSLKKGNKKCALCTSLIESASPVEDLCAACFRVCVQTEAVLHYLRNTSVANLNIIQSSAQSARKETAGLAGVELSRSGVPEEQPEEKEASFAPKIPRYSIVRSKTGEQFYLTKQINKIGKSEELADISIPDNNTLSRCHAVLEKTATGVLIWDCDSKNGTRLGAERLTPNQKVPVRPGDTFRLANEEFVLIDE